jgi:uncharacterized protein YkwD
MITDNRNLRFQLSLVCSDKAISHNCAYDNWAATNLTNVRDAGENVLVNSVDEPAHAGYGSMQQWLVSAGHYMNAMKPGFTHVGLGFFHCPFQSGWGDMFWTALYFSADK